jgi:hypothetical protein
MTHIAAPHDPDPNPMRRSDVPNPRTFDYAMLKKLVLEHPKWSSYRYAQELTRHKRRKDPAAPAVNLHTVDTAIHRYRAEWEAEEGVKIPPRVTSHYQGYTPPRGMVHPDHRTHAALRYLRCLGARDGRATLKWPHVLLWFGPIWRRRGLRVLL